MQRAKGIGVKRMGTLAAVLFLSVFVTACGSKKYLSDIKASDYVTLGNYIGIEASAQEPSVEEDLVVLYIEYYILTEYLTTV